MAIDFPDSPATNDTYTFGDKTWIYADGKWTIAFTSTMTLASLNVTGDLTVDTTTLKVNSSTDRVGIGTASPLSPLHIADSSGYGVRVSATTNLGLIGSNSESDGLRISGGIPDQVTVGGNMYLYGNTHATRAADVALMSNGNEVLTVDGATLRVGIGVLSPATALDIIGTATVRAAATQDGVALAGRAGGTSTYEVTLTPTTLTADRTLTLPDASGTVALTDSAMTSSTFIGTTSVALNRSSGALTLAGITLTTPVLGVASATTINKVALTAPATGSTLTIADGKTLTASNTLTFTGTDASSVAFGAGGTVAYTNVATLSSLTSVGTLIDLTVTNAINGTLTKTVTGTNTADLIYGNMAGNDQFRIRIGGTATNAGYVEIATADDGTEPIYVRQYTGVFTTLTRTATLLDGSGNTSFPGTVTAGTFVTNNSSPSLELGDWSSASTWSAVDGYNGYLLLGNTSNRACYLRSNNAAAVNIGANGSDTLVVNNGNIVVNGTTVNDTLNVIGGSAWFSAMPAGTGLTVVNAFGFLRYVSSRRELKENIVDVELSDGLGRILALRPVEFTMKPEYLADANEYTPFDVKRGFIAQETAEVDHRYGQWGWVDENQMMATEPEVKGELPLEDATPVYWNHDAVIADLVASIQVLTARISELEASQ